MLVTLVCGVAAIGGKAKIVILNLYVVLCGVGLSSIKVIVTG
jgi:hypothetical protein